MVALNSVTTRIHTHGYVKLLDVMGSDEDIVDAARISYDRRGKSEDRALIRYLLRHRHTSPFEMGELKFELKMPVFVARQWVRHRTASMNEVSARYTQLPAEMFVPEVFSVQSATNKQGRGDETAQDFAYEVKVTHANTYDLYEKMLNAGVAKEIARGILPFNIYTKFVWKMDLHNLMHFLNLRLDPHAQKEIRDYAEVIEDIVAEYFPMSHEAFVDYVRDSYTLSRMEVELVREFLNNGKLHEAFLADSAERLGLTKRELGEFQEKFCGK